MKTTQEYVHLLSAYFGSLMPSNIRSTSLSVLVLSVLVFCMSRGQDNRKLAQTGMQFLSALLCNPAMMSQMEQSIDIAASQNQWIADIRHQTISVAAKPFGDQYGVVGFSFQNVDYGEFKWTQYSTDGVGHPDGYIDLPSDAIGTPSAWALGVGYSYAINTQFSVGGQVRYVYQSLASTLIPIDTLGNYDKRKYSLAPLAYDFGTYFKTGFKSLSFGMSIRNFSTEVQYEDDAFTLPMVFTLGISMDMMDFFERDGIVKSVVVTTDASHFRDHVEQVYIGTECSLLDAILLRIGYVTAADEENITYGLGIAQYGMRFDYSITPFGVFDNVQRFSVRFGF
ncbi:MAG: PorV/PorQ family protein [Ignavibacteriales bacterium]|nr:PorV/PorQ family protein [Ignavibacteriales bacterium]